MTGRKIRGKGPKVPDKVALQWLRQRYRVDIVAGEIYSIRTGKPLARFYNEKHDPEHRHPFVRLADRHGQRRGISVARVVWMVSRNAAPPHQCDIHHLDGDPLNNHYLNLVCLHHVDHGLLHQLLAKNEVPF